MSPHGTRQERGKGYLVSQRLLVVLVNFVRSNAVTYSKDPLKNSNVQPSAFAVVSETLQLIIVFVIKLLIAFQQ